MRAIVNFANGIYLKGQERLRTRLKTFDPQTAFFGFSDFKEIDCPSHPAVPYAFKPFAIKHVIDQGYNPVLWLDASFIPHKPLTPVWNHIDKTGYLMEQNGDWKLSQWCTPEALKILELERSQAERITLYSAGMTGIDYECPKAKMFLDSWHNFAKMDPSPFCGPWRVQGKDYMGHRHDMAVGSYLAWLENMVYLPTGHFASYVGKPYPPPSKTSVFYIQHCG